MDGILQMQKFNNLLQMCSFLGAVNRYHRMWPQHAHILAPLSIESRKKTFCRTNKIDLVFKRKKALMAQDRLLVYPNHNIILTTTNHFTFTLMLPVIIWAHI